MTQAAWNPAHQFLGETENLVSNLTGVHQVSCQDKQRDGNQEIGVNTCYHLLANDHQRVIQDQTAQDRTGSDGNADRHSNQQ